MQEICANTFHINIHKSRTETGPSEKCTGLLFSFDLKLKKGRIKNAKSASWNKFQILLNLQTSDQPQLNPMNFLKFEVSFSNFSKALLL